MKMVLTLLVYVDTADEKQPGLDPRAYPDHIWGRFWNEIAPDLAERVADVLGSMDEVLVAQPIGHTVNELAFGLHNTFEEQRASERRFLQRYRKKPGVTSAAHRLDPEAST